MTYKTYIIIAGMLFIATSCKKIKNIREMEDPKNGLELSDVINFAYENDNKEIEADGSDRLFVFADLDTLNVSPNFNVTLTTEQGVFVGGDESTGYRTITVRADGYRAKALLKSDDVVNERVGISARVGEYIIYDELSFTRSYPDEIINSAQKLTLEPNLSDKVIISVDLRKITGLVSQQTRVDFEVITVAGSPQVSIPPLYWTSVNHQAEMITTSLDTGIVAVVPYVFDGVSEIKSIDTLFIYIDN